MKPRSISYSRHWLPAEIISHVVWPYHVFSLGLRDVALILAARCGCHLKEYPNWCRKFGADFTKDLRRHRARPGDTWHLDEVFIQGLGGVALPYRPGPDTNRLWLCPCNNAHHSLSHVARKVVTPAFCISSASISLSVAIKSSWFRVGVSQLHPKPPTRRLSNSTANFYHVRRRYLLNHAKLL